MVAEMDTRERARREAEEDDRADAAVVAHFARIRGGDDLVVTLEDLAAHCATVADSYERSQSELDRMVANNLRIRAEVWTEAARLAREWFADNVFVLGEAC